MANTKNFSTLISDMAAAVQGAASSLIDLTVGSVLLAVMEAVAATVLWIQGLILALLATTRAATCSGSDLDSWMADFGFSRVGAVFATGTVTFSRFTPTAQAVVPIGASLQTADGSQLYTVSLDGSNVNYNVTLGGYVLAPGTASISVPVVANVAGAKGNAVAGQLNTITTSIVGVDTVTNASTFTVGADAELDSAFRARFVVYLNSLSKGVPAAVKNAAAGVAGVASNSLTENLTYAGAAQGGFFYLVIDDGTGAPSTALQNAVYAAVDAVRPITTTFAVYACAVVTANIALTVTIASGYDPTATRLLVTNAIKSYVNGLGVGVALQYTRLSLTAFNASPGVATVAGVTLNSGVVDLAANAQQAIKYGTVTVS